jgi:nicotinate-nucleotide--dimethylbenzimidazole phosphoribosyltransferase
MGVDHDFPRQDDLLIRKAGYGTANFAQGPAMSEEACRLAMEAGLSLAHAAKNEGVELAATGDMGIGNTTASSAVIAALTGKPVREVTGRGTGIDDEALEKKIAVIEKGLEVNRHLFTDSIHVLQAVGGFEIAGIAGFILGCAVERLPVVIDGLAASAGALVALELNSNIKDYIYWGHRSFERGHDTVLKKYHGRPILDLDMRLGEGSGACLAMQILDVAVKIYNEVATFEEAEVATRKIREELAL